MDERLSFIVAGVQKCGTTVLHDHLARLPGLQGPRCKELHFFDDESQDWEAPDYGRLHAAFPAFDGRARFEATPVTVYWPNALERARRYNPDLKLVLLFRDPVVRAYSHWRMESGRGLEDQGFSGCIREGRARVGSAHRVHSYVERGFYGRLLAHAVSLFGREQVLCLGNGALRRDPAGVVTQILSFVGMPEPPDLGELLAATPSAGPQPGKPSDDDVRHLRALYATDFADFLEMSGLNPEDLEGQPHLS